MPMAHHGATEFGELLLRDNLATFFGGGAVGHYFFRGALFFFICLVTLDRRMTTQLIWPSVRRRLSQEKNGSPITWTRAREGMEKNDVLGYA